MIKTILRAMAIIVLNVIFIPIKLIILLAMIAVAINGKINYGLTFKESWESCKEGCVKGIKQDLDFIRTGKINFD